MDSHSFTDNILRQTEKELIKLYTKNYNLLKVHIREVVDKMSFNSKMTPLERYQNSLKYDRLIKLQKMLAQELSNTAKEGVKIINANMKTIYKANYDEEMLNLGVMLSTAISPQKAIEQTKSPFDTLAIEEAKSISDLRREIARQFTQGIMQGENSATLITRFKKIVELKLSDLNRIARTETTRVENIGRLNAYKVGADLGYVMLKTWVAKGDNRTRPAHKDASGQTVPIDEPFIVDGEKLMYPGDPNGSAKNVINCRCTMRASIKKI